MLHASRQGMRGSASLVGEGAGRDGGKAREAEVAKLDGARGADENIGGLYIAVEHAERMEVFQSSQQALHVVLDSALGEGCLGALDAVGKRARHAFHDDDEG